MPVHCYRDHIDRYLIPSIGQVSLADLTGRRLQACFDLIARQRTRKGRTDRRVHRRRVRATRFAAPWTRRCDLVSRMVAEAAMIRELDVHAHRIARGAADLIRRRAGARTIQERSVPEQLARLAEAMIRHTRRMDPDRWPEVTGGVPGRAITRPARAAAGTAGS